MSQSPFIISVRLSVCLSHLRSAGSAQRTNNKKLSSVPHALYVFNLIFCSVNSAKRNGCPQTMKIEVATFDLVRLRTYQILRRLYQRAQQRKVENSREKEKTKFMTVWIDNWFTKSLFSEYTSAYTSVQHSTYRQYIKNVREQT